MLTLARTLLKLRIKAFGMCNLHACIEGMVFLENIELLKMASKLALSTGTGNGC